MCQKKDKNKIAMREKIDDEVTQVGPKSFIYSPKSYSQIAYNYVSPKTTTFMCPTCNIRTSGIILDIKKDVRRCPICKKILS